MKKLILLIVLLLVTLFPMVTKAQNESNNDEVKKSKYTKNIKLGFGLGIDFGLKFSENSQYKIKEDELGLKFSSSLDFFVKIPLKYKFSFYPMFNFNIKGASTSLINNQGTNNPEGYTVRQAYSGSTEPYYSKDYKYYISDGNISQICVGGFITKEIYKRLEIGSGLFFKYIDTEIKNYYAIDQYSWESSTGTQWDNYIFTSTNVIKSNPTIINNYTKTISIPLLFQYTSNFDTFYIGYSFIIYFGSNTFFSTRLTFSI